MQHEISMFDVFVDVGLDLGVGQVGVLANRSLPLGSLTTYATS